MCLVGGNSKCVFCEGSKQEQKNREREGDIPPPSHTKLDVRVQYVSPKVAARSRARIQMRRGEREGGRVPAKL